jgi:glycerol uptake facilitator protein
MKALFLDEKGAAHPIVMGCYGIGISRTLAAALETNRVDVVTTAANMTTLATSVHELTAAVRNGPSVDISSATIDSLRLAIYAVGAISGAHLNPAVTITMAVYRGFPWRKVLPYALAQLVGAVIGAAVLHGLFSGLIAHFEVTKHIVRGAPGSELSGMMYGEYFPNPAMIGTTPEAYATVSRLQAFCGEAIGTAFLLFFICAMVDTRNPGRPMGTMSATFIGLTVAVIISIVAPLTQAGLNPARDFGPRLFAYFAGWGHIAIPGARGGFFDVYILAPIVGGLCGAGIYDLFVRRFHNPEQATAATDELLPTASV